MEEQVIADKLRKRIRAFEDVIDADQLPFQPGDDFMANPVLHLCLYVNMLFSILSWLTTILLLQPRFYDYEDKYRMVVLFIVTFFTITEIIRIYSGLGGNKGKVPLMILFLILTAVMLPSALAVLLTRLSADFTPVECNIMIGYMLMQAVEWVLGYLGYRHMKQVKE
ncbi:transmembrane protein 17-like [Hemiscyllium ocellatum]|uniref:transmembrane protein 17-like n=1 Tax=Hemiscyllium ocellatum TaxID=170820 RepID=UPI002965ED68|nr:transmembrane protein 17-like [Hemiscyllium ocellatum]